MHGETTTPRFRLRFSLKAMMIVVLLMSFGLGGGMLLRRSWKLREVAARQAWFADRAKVDARIMLEQPPSPTDSERLANYERILRNLNRMEEHCSSLADKYYATSWTPWRSIEPDPPEPEYEMP